MRLKQIIQSAEAELAFWLASGFDDWCAGNVLGQRLALRHAQTAVRVIEHATALLPG